MNKKELKQKIENEDIWGIVVRNKKEVKRALEIVEEYLDYSYFEEKGVEFDHLTNPHWDRTAFMLKSPTGLSDLVNWRDYYLCDADMRNEDYLISINKIRYEQTKN